MRGFFHDLNPGADCNGAVGELGERLSRGFHAAQVVDDQGRVEDSGHETLPSRLLPAGRPPPRLSAAARVHKPKPSWSRPYLTLRKECTARRTPSAREMPSVRQRE